MTFPRDRYKERNAMIVRDHQNGAPVSELAEAHRVSVRQVYNILKAQEQSKGAQ